MGSSHTPPRGGGVPPGLSVGSMFWAKLSVGGTKTRIGRRRRPKLSVGVERTGMRRRRRPRVSVGVIEKVLVLKNKRRDTVEHEISIVVLG